MLNVISDLAKTLEEFQRIGIVTYAEEPMTEMELREGSNSTLLQDALARSVLCKEDAFRAADRPVGGEAQLHAAFVPADAMARPCYHL